MSETNRYRVFGRRRASLLPLYFSASWLACLAAFAQQTNLATAALPTPIWKTSMGGGFSRGASDLDISLGGGPGLKVMGSHKAHALVLATAQYGWMLSDVVAPDHWFRGNWELENQLFGGAQVHPDAAGLAGIAGLLRYNFATGHRWVPFLDAGAGIVATSIRNGDLSTAYEFTLQAGAGSHFLLRENLALTLQYRFIHLSNANTHVPNLGVNTGAVLLGITRFF